MPLASVENVGGYLGLYEVQTPSGRTVSVSAEEEEEITKRALIYTVEQEITRGERLREAAVMSAIGALGSAAGLALGGWVLGKVLGAAGGALMR